MIETEEQRRWWFATHPEYSWSRRGGTNRGHKEEKEEDDRVRPEDVDAYVDEALKYVDGSVADLLKSVKRNFGTEGDTRKGGQGSGVWAGNREGGDVGGGRSGDFPWSKDEDSQGLPPRQTVPWFGPHVDGWLSLTGSAPDGGAFMPRLPTVEELFRQPKEQVQRFFRWLDRLWQESLLIADPNALERHHLLVKKFTKYFMDCGLAVEDFVVIMRAGDHRLKPDGVHTGEGRGGDWNTEWEKFIKENPLTYTPLDEKRVKKQLNEMIRKYGIDKKAILSPTRPKRR